MIYIDLYFQLEKLENEEKREREKKLNPDEHQQELDKQQLKTTLYYFLLFLKLNLYNEHGFINPQTINLFFLLHFKSCHHHSMPIIAY